MTINFCPAEVFKKNLYLIGVLLCANLLGIVSRYYFDQDYVFGLVGLFNFNTEKNIPTLYSTVALIFSSILLLTIAYQNKKLKLSYIPWLWLSIIFLFLSFDEMFSIHETLIVPVRETLGTSGLFYFAWVIPYGLALIIFIIAYAKFLFDLPNKIMLLFLISGSIFVVGAIGFELLGGRHADLYGRNNILYATLSTCEELLEMLGIAVFIYTLLTYMIHQYESVMISISNNK